VADDAPRARLSQQAAEKAKNRLLTRAARKRGIEFDISALRIASLKSGGDG